MLLGMWTTYPNNEQMIKDAKKFKLTDEFEETVSETMFFQCVSFRGWGDSILFSKKTSQIIFQFSWTKSRLSWYVFLRRKEEPEKNEVYQWEDKTKELCADNFWSR